MLFSSSLLSTGIITAGEVGLSSCYFEDKVAKAIRQLKSGKAPGICGIPAELLKARNNVLVKWLTTVIRVEDRPACTACNSSSESEILRRTGIARNCVTLLEKHVWKSHIRVDRKVRLYQTYVIPVLMYGLEAWTITKALAWRLDAFDTWSL